MSDRCCILDNISKHQQPYQASKLLCSNGPVFSDYLGDLHWVFRVPDEEFAIEVKVE